MLNVPKLRFGEFEGEWVERKLSDLGNFKNGLNKSKEDFGHGLPFINLMDVFGKSVISNKNLGLVNSTKKELEAYSLQQGDILFIRSSVKKEGVGETALVLDNLENTTYSGFLIRFRENSDDLDLLYKKYCFKTKKFRNRLLSLSTTSANTNINQELLNLLKLNLPLKPEQQKIAKFLTSTDQKIEQLNQKRTLFGSYKKGLMQKIFSQEIRFKRDDGGEFEDWVEKRLSDLLIIQRGASPRPIQAFIAKKGVNWIKIGDIAEGAKYIEKTREKITHEGSKKSRMIQPDDFILSNSMSFGRPYISKISGCIHDGWLLLRNIDNHILSNNFLYELLSSEKIKKQFKSLAAGSTVNNLKSETVKTVKIQLPSIKEQNKIATFLTSIDQKITQTTQELEQMKHFKKGLLQGMFV
jgi:type I restriction enzyme S subunit